MSDITTKTELSAQEVFDHVVRHAAGMTCKSLIEPKGPSFGDICAYRSPDGNSCFVGCLMSEAEARQADYRSLHGLGGSISTLAEGGWLPERLVPHEALLADLQPIHDDQDMSLWPLFLHSTGTSFSLDTTVVDEAFAGRS